MALTINNLDALTHRHIQKFIVDNVYNSQAFLMRLKKKGIAIRGGSSIQQPIMYAELSSGTSYNGSDTWSSPSVDEAQFTNAKFEWKEYVVPFAVSDRLANIQNDGDEAAVDYMDAKINAATKRLTEILSLGLFSDGTGNSGNDITGLKALLSDSVTYGGLDVATFTTWKAKKLAALTNPGELIIADMVRLWGKATIGADVPTLILSNQDVWNKFNTLLEPQRRYVNTQQAEAGFPVVEFMAKPYMVDNHTEGSGDGTADNGLYFLNENYITLFVKKDREFNTVAVPAQINSANMYFRVHWAGNLACSDRRMHAFDRTINPALLSA